MVRSLVGKHPLYYEAVLQLREVTQEVVTFAEEELSKHKIPIAKVVELKNGFDYYIADNDFTKALGKKLQQRFGGQVRNTSSLFGRKENKEIYRGTVLFRLAAFCKGDKISYNGEEYLVKLISKEITLIHSKTGKKERVKFKDMKGIKRISE